uniref:Peroxidase n=1 Tax=Kalanchoe fedtschenkoi TaxID=63787 RepID=A0A7N0V1D2_KALFE
MASTASAFSILTILLLSATFSESKLSTSYYAKTCPRLEQIVTEAVTTKQISNPTTAAGALRLFVHDCFVEGCDASVLVSSNAFNKAERDSDINLSLPGDAFDLVTRIKTSLELQCPGIVSCADVLALATRDAVKMVGGPYYKVRLGRKDSFVSKAANVEGNLPRLNMSLDQIIGMFAKKGFTVRELVALTGGHTIGFSHCREFADRIYNYSKDSAFDPAINPKYAAGLRKHCENYTKVDGMSAFNDVITPGKFDNMYYQNLKRGLGLLSVDSVMWGDKRTRPYVETYAADQQLFFADFAKAMEKMSVMEVKTGRKGEVRNRCDAFNELRT